MTIIVTDLNNPALYRIWTVVGHIPSNYVCMAPSDENEKQALLDEQANDGQTLIVQYVNSQIN